MARNRHQGNGSGTVYPRKNKDGKIIGYRGSYFTPDSKRRYVSGKTKTEAQRALRKATADATGRRAPANTPKPRRAGRATPSSRTRRWPTPHTSMPWTVPA